MGDGAIGGSRTIYCVFIYLVLIHPIFTAYLFQILSIIPLKILPAKLFVVKMWSKNPQPAGRGFSDCPQASDFLAHILWQTFEKRNTALYNILTIIFLLSLLREASAMIPAPRLFLSKEQ